MAEVAPTPSHSSAAAGAAVAAVAGRSSAFDSSPVARAVFPQPSMLDQHRSAQLPYNSAHSPGDDAAFFSHNPRASPGGSAHLSPPSERSVPRALPSIASTMPGASPPAVAFADPRAPVSPGAVSLTLSEPPPAADGPAGDPAPRKRSKVSRACDECRRKKIRCDATSESGIEQCSSCKRVGSKCSFSRVPMKRGPSKGYIKELADRLNTLENSIQGDLHPYAVSGESEHSPGPSDSTSPPPPSISGAYKQPRKRTLSSSSDFQSGVHLQPLTQSISNPLPRSSERLPSIESFHPSTQLQHQQRSQQLETQRQLPHPGLAHGRPHPPHPSASRQHPANSATADTSSSYKNPLSPEGGSYLKGLSDLGVRRASVSFPFEMGEHQPPSIDREVFEWHEDLIDQYYTLIHPTFPLLPHSKPRLRYLLENAPNTIRNALLEALYAVVRSNPSSTFKDHSAPPNPKRACELAMASQFEDPASRANTTTDILYLQTLILMALESDNHGPATMKGQLGPPRATWLGSAVGLAYNLKLHHGQSQERFSGDRDSDEKLGRRAWWVLVTLDRWHAISTASPLFIHDLNVVLLAEDRDLLGEGPYHIARLSCILGHLAEVFTAPDEVLSAATVNRYISKLLRGELERFRESVEVVWGSLNLLHLAYYHVKLLTLRHNPLTEPQQLLEPAARMATMLDNSRTPITPLNHHFAALALLTLVDLTEIQETRDGAWRGIQQLTEALETRRGLSTRDDSIGWDRAIKDLIIKRTQMRLGTAAPPSDLPPGHGNNNLQHLAELAIGDRSPSSGTSYSGLSSGGGLDSGRLQRFGYLGSILL